MSPGSVADRTEGSRGAEGGSVQMFVPLDLRANRMCACVKVEITEVADAVVTAHYENTLVSEYLFDQIQDSNPQLVQVNEREMLNDIPYSKHPILSIGISAIGVGIGERMFTHYVHVVRGLPLNCVAGADYLVRIGAQIDFRPGLLHARVRDTHDTDVSMVVG
ncbi:UNVERIFIED_CONTAM: hypothetical protein FKN15_073465 [Acipenser sinensis]